MASATSYITDALKELGVYAAGETVSANDLADGLNRVNQMLASWSIESLTVFATLEQSGTLVANQYQYTIGTGGNFNITRPDRIKFGPGSAYFVDGNSNRYPVDVITQDKWNLISNLVLVNSNIPQIIFYDPQFPLGIINVYPTPNTSGTLYWDSDLPLTQFPDLTTSITFPPGYDLAITTNLAVHLKPYFATAQLDPDIRQQARESKANIKRLNYRPTTSLYDGGIVATPKKTWDWRTGNF